MSIRIGEEMKTVTFDTGIMIRGCRILVEVPWGEKEYLEEIEMCAGSASDILNDAVETYFRAKK